MTSTHAIFPFGQSLSAPPNQHPNPEHNNASTSGRRNNAAQYQDEFKAAEHGIYLFLGFTGIIFAHRLFQRALAHQFFKLHAGQAFDDRCNG